MNRSPRLGRWAVRTSLTLASRSWVLFVTLVVAAAGFAVLTAQSETTRLDVVETAESNARAAYDILVRPRGARLPLEQDRGLIQPGFLASYPQGITEAQWRSVQTVPGVEIAAPIAVVGWVVPSVQVPVDLSGVASGRDEPTLLRRDTVWRYDNGASTVRSAPAWEYLTGNRVLLQRDPAPPQESYLVERFPDGRAVEHRNLGAGPTDTVQEVRDGYQVACAEVSTSCRFGFHPVNPSFPYPFLVVAVDPASEAALSGLDSAVTTGSYLDGAALAEQDISTDQDGSDPRRMVPVLVADRPQLQLSATYRVQDLGIAAAASAAAGRPVSALSSTTGKVIAEGTLDADDVYEQLVSDMTTPGRVGAYYATSIRDVFRTGPGRFTPGGGDTLVADSAAGDPLAWDGRFDIAESRIPPGADDTAFHDLTGYVANGDGSAPGLLKVGTFDAERLVGTDLSEVPLGTYAFSPPEGTDDASRAALRSQTWQPSANIWGFSQAPPLMVTSLAALPAFSDRSAWSGIGRAGTSQFGATPVADDALTAIRVRVAGVDGIDAVSGERVRVVAEAIATRTGLDVDITLGSSPSPQSIAVPAGRHGRPALAVTQNWVEKGVAVSLIRAADRKSVLLNVAILVVCAVVVNNAALASVRARRRQIATLRLTGWSRGAVVRLELGTLVILSHGAGLVAAVVALLVGHSAGLELSIGQAALSVPAAVAVAVLAGSAAAVAAARAPALDAVQPSGSRPVRGFRRSVRGQTGVAFRAMVASPGRSLLTVAAVAVASAALAVLLAVQAQFEGQAVGSLLGDAIAVQVRGPDLAAAAAILLLAGVGVAHSLTLEVRERAPELATFRATGWTERALTRLLLTQAVVTGLTGAVLGTGAALLIQDAVLGEVTWTTIVADAVAALLALAVAAAATWAPGRLLSRIPTPTLLAEE
jgi:putative ABC transport system permease protein